VRVVAICRALRARLRASRAGSGFQRGSQGYQPFPSGGANGLQGAHFQGPRHTVRGRWRGSLPLVADRRQRGPDGGERR
jgi:hypothetical protein